MRLSLALSLAASTALSACGACGWFPLLPDARTPTDRAHELAERCKDESEPSAAYALSPSIIESVEPVYVRFQSGGGAEKVRLRGANLHLRPALSTPPAVLQRALECHQARVTLGNATEVPDEPYVLAGSWLDIDVTSTREGLVAAVETDSFEDAKRVVDRARKFATSAR